MKRLLGFLAYCFMLLLAAGLLQLRAPGSRAHPMLQPVDNLYFPLLSRERDTKTLPPILITEVYYDPNLPEPEGEWFELYNPTGERVDLSVHKVGDSEQRGDAEGMLQFPEGCWLEPGQALIIANQAAMFAQSYGFLPDFELSDTRADVPELAGYDEWSAGRLELVNSGDEILVLDAQDNVIDAVSWGDSQTAFSPSVNLAAAGNSLERLPANRDTDSASDWKEQSNPTPGKVDLTVPTRTPTPRPTPLPYEGQLLISEVVYDPEGSEPAFEWIEIYNPSDMRVSLYGFKIGDEERAGGDEGMYAFPEQAVIGAGETLLVANQAASFLAEYGFSPDYELRESDPSVPDLVRYDIWANGTVLLNNSGDDLLLLDYYDSVIDAISWGGSSFVFDPSIPLVAEGHSLERFPADQDTDTADDWRDQKDPDPGAVSNPLPTSTVTHTPSITPTLTVTETETPVPTPVTPMPVDYLVISELYYVSVHPEPDAEWVEIYNPTMIEIDLSQYKIGDEETMGGSEGMLIFPPGTVIHPEQVVVIAHRAAMLQLIFGVLPDFEMVDSDPTVPEMLTYASWGTGLVRFANEGDEVLLLDGSDHLVDALSWGISTFAFNPPCPGVLPDHSLERFPANYDTNRASDWSDQESPNPGQVFLRP